jgi:actin-like ATPase involved in cell morphogenesis
MAAAIGIGIDIMPRNMIVDIGGEQQRFGNCTLVEGHENAMKE